MSNIQNYNNSLTFVEKCKDGFSVGGKSWNVSWNVFFIRWTSTVLFTLNPGVKRDDVTKRFEDATEMHDMLKTTSASKYLSPVKLSVTQAATCTRPLISGAV